VFIHTIHSRIANCYIIQAEQSVILVDTGFSNATGEILRTLDQLGHSPRDLRLILLTHVHLDHAGSAAELRRLTGAPIAIHRADLGKARAGEHTMPTGRGVGGKILELAFNGARFKFRFERFEPDLFLEEGALPPEFGLDARIISTPGHTLGSISLDVGDGVLLIGDAVINQIRVGMPMYGEEIALAYDSLRKLNVLRPRVLYSGHGTPFTGEDLARYFIVKRLQMEQVKA
jgi:glyoxylase-like metal-dependent hydrolase (beta-lactamase superfamily II)